MARLLDIADSALPPLVTEAIRVDARGVVRITAFAPRGYGRYVDRPFAAEPAPPIAAAPGDGPAAAAAVAAQVAAAAAAGPARAAPATADREGGGGSGAGGGPPVLCDADLVERSDGDSDEYTDSDSHGGGASSGSDSENDADDGGAAAAAAEGDAAGAEAARAAARAAARREHLHPVQLFGVPRRRRRAGRPPSPDAAAVRVDSVERALAYHFKLARAMRAVSRSRELREVITYDVGAPGDVCTPQRARGVIAFMQYRAGSTRTHPPYRTEAVPENGRPLDDPQPHWVTLIPASAPFPVPPRFRRPAAFRLRVAALCIVGWVLGVLACAACFAVALGTGRMLFVRSGLPPRFNHDIANVVVGAYVAQRIVASCLVCGLGLTCCFAGVVQQVCVCARAVILVRVHGS